MKVERIAIDITATKAGHYVWTVETWHDGPLSSPSIRLSVGVSAEHATELAMKEVNDFFRFIKEQEGNNAGGPTSLGSGVH